MPVRAMMSVRNTAIAAQIVSPELEQYSCSVPLVLLIAVLFLYNQVTDIRPRRTKVVVSGNILENTHSYNSTRFPAVLFVQES